MPEQSPAETLRAAASLLRQRAEEATPGPWKPMVLGSEGYLVHRDSGTIRERGRGRVARFGCKDWDADRADAEYVASMSPAVGVPLAEWLDADASSADSLLVWMPGGVSPLSGADHDAGWGCNRCYGWLDECKCWPSLTVARAYLGETDA
jgi:hypothetical protein